MIASVLAVLAGFALMVVVVMLTTPMLAKVFLRGTMPGALTTSYLVSNLSMAALAALGGGYLTSRLAPHAPMAHGAALAALMLLMSLASMRQSLGSEPRWYAVTLATLMPALTLGGAWLCSRTM